MLGRRLKCQPVGEAGRHQNFDVIPAVLVDWQQHPAGLASPAADGTIGVWKRRVTRTAECREVRRQRGMVGRQTAKRSQLQAGKVNRVAAHRQDIQCACAEQQIVRMGVNAEVIERDFRRAGNGQSVRHLCGERAGNSEAEQQDKAVRTFAEAVEPGIKSCLFNPFPRTDSLPQKAVSHGNRTQP